ncbi:MAG: hypothetical protein J6Q22_03225 [Prevotella sp.]|nr:hypothetical protein [Prevotella sp.]
MADASLETIRRLIENSEKGLKDIELTLPTILKARQAVDEAFKKQERRDADLDLELMVLDTLLAENEVTYDLTASLDALLKATDIYTKRYYMQSLNLCFYEACQSFVGEDDQFGLLTRLEQRMKQLNQAGCQYIAKHIIGDIQEFRKDFCDKELRNITRHYDDPIKMYEKQQELNNIEPFAEGVSKLLAIRMEVSVLSSFLLSLLPPVREESQNVVSGKRCGLYLKGMLNEAIYKAFNKGSLKEEVQRSLNKGQDSLDDCYELYNKCVSAEKILEAGNIQIPEEMKKMESLIQLRMEALYLRNDIACSVWGYLNAASDKERSQNLRLIHITKQAALTHIYGYTETVRAKSLWAAIKEIEGSCCEKLNSEKMEKSLKELTGNLDDDKTNSRMFAHYRYKQDFYIPARLEAFNKMEHPKEMIDAMKLLKNCKALETYTAGLLYCIDGKQKLKKKTQHDRWTEMMDRLVDKAGKDEKVKEALTSMRDLIDHVYGDKETIIS